MNNTKLKAIRQGIGLTVAEAANLMGVTKRSFQYWESGRHPVPDDCIEKFNHLRWSIHMVIELMQEDIKLYNQEHDMSFSDDMQPISKLVLPFFVDFEKFKKVTGCPLVQFWRLYQAVISHLLLTNWITYVDDETSIPDSFLINDWLSDYTHHHTERWEYDRENGGWH